MCHYTSVSECVQVGFKISVWQILSVQFPPLGSKVHFMSCRGHGGVLTQLCSIGWRDHYKQEYKHTIEPAKSADTGFVMSSIMYAGLQSACFVAKFASIMFAICTVSKVYTIGYVVVSGN